jgi:hypothetical protein
MRSATTCTANSPRRSFGDEFWFNGMSLSSAAKCVDKLAACVCSTTLRTAFTSLEKAFGNATHASRCSHARCTLRSHSFTGARGLHSTASTNRLSSPEVVLRSDTPSNRAYTGTQPENSKEYAAKMRDYRAQVAVLRKEWMPLVHQHNKKVRSAINRWHEAISSCKRCSH